MPVWLGGCPDMVSLLIALVCWWIACFALMRRDWYARHGFSHAMAIFCARLRREPSTWWLCILGVIGSGAITAVWALWPNSWTSLFTALIGMAAAGGLVWIIRIVATAVLRREAMGFGDVTLMAMIGAFLGWQASLIVFFFAPIIALIVGLIVLVIKRDQEIPYGPFLCLATLFVVLRWSSIWQWVEPRFALGMLIPVIIFVCLVIMPVLLILLQAIIKAVRLAFAKRS
jgi:prepilin signal peptidase PulO-like enzyme (type II secretory pathway)